MHSLPDCPVNYAGRRLGSSHMLVSYVSRLYSLCSSVTLFSHWTPASHTWAGSLSSLSGNKVLTPHQGPLSLPAYLLAFWLQTSVIFNFNNLLESRNLSLQQFWVRLYVTATALAFLKSAPLSNGCEESREDSLPDVNQIGHTSVEWQLTNPIFAARATDNAENCELPRRYKLWLCWFRQNVIGIPLMKRRCSLKKGWETTYNWVEAVDGDS